MTPADEPQIPQIPQMTDPSLAPESAPSAASRGRKRSGGNLQVPDDTVASYSAARAFLLGEWFGASLAVSSFTLLYLFAFGGHGDTRTGFIACIALLVVGSWAYLRSRAYYGRVGFDYAPRWHLAALVVAGSAGIFWLLFALLTALTWMGVPVLPD